MKIMRLSYGMANTMFQYATYLQLKKMYPNEDVYVDTMWFDVTEFPYELKKAFGIEVSDYDFYETAKREGKLDYKKEFEKLRFWKEFGYESLISTRNVEGLMMSGQEYPELYLKAGYDFEIVLICGKTVEECRQVLKGQWNEPPKQKLKRNLDKILGEYNPMFRYVRTLKWPYKRHKLLCDLKNGRKPDFCGSLPLQRLRHEGDVFYCTFGNENDVVGIEDELRKVFTFVPFEEENNIWLAEDIAKHESVAVHARVIDFKYGMSAALSRDYYKKAVRYMEKRLGNGLKYYIFSDRPRWVKEHLELLGMDEKKEYVIVENNNGENAFRDMQLMSLCSHNISAQSTFSWWGGFLSRNKNKIHITPYETFPGTISF